MTAVIAVIVKDLKTLVYVKFGGVFPRSAHPAHQPVINTGNKSENACKGYDTQIKKYRQLD
jgi:hypothetical protein